MDQAVPVWRWGLILKVGGEARGGQVGEMAVNAQYAFGHAAFGTGPAPATNPATNLRVVGRTEATAQRQKAA
jgi:hypothetical protein